MEPVRSQSYDDRRVNVGRHCQLQLPAFWRRVSGPRRGDIVASNEARQNLNGGPNQLIPLQCTASGRGILEFLVGSKRSGYSTPVYLFIVFIVSVVLWGVMPWIISAYGDE